MISDIEIIIKFILLWGGPDSFENPNPYDSDVIEELRGWPESRNELRSTMMAEIETCAQLCDCDDSSCRYCLISEGMAELADQVE